MGHGRIYLEINEPFVSERQFYFADSV